MLTRFENYLRNIKGYSERTSSEYIKDLRGFARWIKHYYPSVRWSTLEREHIDAYITARASANIAPATTNRELAAISALYRYFQREGLTDRNPAKYMSRRKTPKNIPSTIPTEDLKQAYANAYGLVKVWIGLLATTGMRISEMQLLKWEDIDFEHNLIEIKGKGKKERLLHTTSEALEQLRALKARSCVSGFIFGHYGQREMRYQIFKALQPYSTAKQLSPHAIRHTFATNLATNGVNVSTIASILGHNHIETTQKYIDLSQARREVANRYSII